MKIWRYRHEIFYGGLSEFVINANETKHDKHKDWELVGFQVYGSSITVPRPYVSAVFKREE